MLPMPGPRAMATSVSIFMSCTTSSVSICELLPRGFGVPVGIFMRALCEYYGVELHNFCPNSISQAAVFVAICEGYLGIEAHWDLWIPLFRGELFVENARGQPK